MYLFCRMFYLLRWRRRDIHSNNVSRVVEWWGAKDNTCIYTSGILLRRRRRLLRPCDLVPYITEPSDAGYIQRERKKSGRLFFSFFFIEETGISELSSPFRYKKLPCVFGDPWNLNETKPVSTSFRFCFKFLSYEKTIDLPHIYIQFFL